MSERVLAVIVCFNPDIRVLRRTLHALANQVSNTIIVDNSSSNKGQIIKLAAEISHENRVLVLPQSNNLGLGGAHNIGFRYAEQHNYSQVLLLDQDSVPLAGMVEALQTALFQKRKEKVAAVGATYLNANNGSESFFIKFGWLKFRRHYCGERDQDGCIVTDFLISSGSLIPLTVIAEIGSMDEALFIDHIDTEWFLRARSHGLRAYGVCDAVMQHGLGEQTHRITLKRERNIPQHQPFRYYYIFRNSIILYKRRYVSWLWKWNDVQRLVLIALMFSLWKRPRRDNASMMLKGVWHGLRGVTGPLKI